VPWEIIERNFSLHCAIGLRDELDGWFAQCVAILCSWEHEVCRFLSLDPLKDG